MATSLGERTRQRMERNQQLQQVLFDEDRRGLLPLTDIRGCVKNWPGGA